MRRIWSGRRAGTSIGFCMGRHGGADLAGSLCGSAQAWRPHNTAAIWPFACRDWFKFRSWSPLFNSIHLHNGRQEGYLVAISHDLIQNARHVWEFFLEYLLSRTLYPVTIISLLRISSSFNLSPANGGSSVANSLNFFGRCPITT